MADLKIEGMEELLKKFKKLPKKLQNSILTGGIRAGAKLVADEARRNVPVKTGHLKKSILVRKRRRGVKKGTLHFVVAPVSKVMWRFQDIKGKKHFNYGNIIEEGRSVWAVEHGSSKSVAKPFMRPAFESKGKEAINATRDYMKQRMSKFVKAL